VQFGLLLKLLLDYLVGSEDTKMKVKELIEILLSFNPEKEIKYSSYGEQILMEISGAEDNDSYVSIEGD